MISDLIGKVWRRLPRRARRSIIKFTQQRFTVSAAAVIRNDDGEVLLLEHYIRPLSAWGLPGGFLERGEQPEAGIRREIREETGLELDDVRIVDLRTIGSHLEMIFASKAKGTVRLDAAEIKDFGWFRPDRVPEQMSGQQKRDIARVMADGFVKTKPDD
ncbi:MAG: NUDIX hydrolase [Pyrinomonadaceae bacterium]